MPIKVSSAEFITKNRMNDAVSYYNSLRPEDFEDIELVEYKNSTQTTYGFRIASTDTNHSYSNGTHKYMRWQTKTLASMYNYPPFSVEEEVLLFRVIRFVLGKENVFYFRTYDQAIKNSPCFNHVVFSNLLSKSPPQKTFITNIVNEIFKPAVVDKNTLSLSTNSGWKFPRVRI